MRPWQFTASICFFIILTQLTEPPHALSGKSRFRCEVMIWRALNALKCICIICRWFMGKSASTHDPYDPSKKLTHLTHWPMTHRPIVYSAVRRAAAALGGRRVSIDISCPPGPRQQTRRTFLQRSTDETDGRTDGRTGRRDVTENLPYILCEQC